MKLYFAFLAIFLGLSLQAKPNKPAGFVLFFQPLYQLPENTTQSYINELRILLSESNDKNLNSFILKKYQNDTCYKKKSMTCLHGLYKTKQCSSLSEIAVKTCLKKSGNSSSSSYFQESVFNRLQWNHFALQLSHYCQLKITTHCQKLSLLHEKYLKIYRDRFSKKKPKKKKVKEKKFNESEWNF